RLCVSRATGEPYQRAVVIEQEDPFLCTVVLLQQLIAERVGKQFSGDRGVRLSCCREFFYEFGGPSDNVVATEPVLHRGISPDLLIARHEECFVERGGNLFPVIGINDNRFAELLGGARHLAEYEDARSVVSAGDILLRDEIHPVPERRD